MHKRPDIVEVFTRIRGDKAMRRFFDELLTPAERRKLALRWRVLEMLAEGVPQRRIGADLGVSLCMITRGARILRQRSSAAREVLQRLTGLSSRYKARR